MLNSLRPVAAIAGHTFTDLVRQRVFHLLLFFALLLMASSLYLARFSFEEEFQILKDISLGAMSLFTSLLAILATARLLARDLEDRTIYTILARPVSRLAYLAGKLIGVLLLLAVCLAIMSALFSALLYLREQTLLHQAVLKLPAAQRAPALQQIRYAAFSGNLAPSILLLFAKAAVLAAFTLLISTFASSHLFTVVVMFGVYLIGHLQATARASWVAEHSSGWLTSFFLGFVALVFPDLQAFNLVDQVAGSAAIPLAFFLKTALLATLYTAIYLLFATIVLNGKEL